MGKSAILSVRIIGDGSEAKKAFQDTEDAAAGFGAKLKGLAPVAAAGVGAMAGGAVIAGKALYDIGSTFDDVTDTIRVGTGASGDALNSLVDTAKAVGASIPTTFGDAATAVADLNTRLGLTGPELETVSKQVLEAGRLTGEALDVGTITGAFNQFGLAQADIADGMDTLFRVSQATGIGMNDLGGAVATAGPALQGLGFSFEQSAAMLGAFDKAGLNSQAITSAMGKGLVQLAKAGEEPQAAFQRVTGEIGQLVSAGDDAKALDLAAQLFGTKGAAQFVGALKDGTIGAGDMMTTIGATSDTILGLGQETADAAEKWQILQNQAMAALEPIASAVFDGVGAALTWLTGVISGIDWAPIINGVQQAAEWFSGLTNHVTGVADGISTFVGGVAAQLAPFLPTIQEIWDQGVAIFSNGITAVTEFVQLGIAALIALWDTFGPPIISTVTTVFAAVMGVIGPAIDFVRAVISTALAVINGDWSGAWDGVKNIVSSAWNLIKSIISGAISTVSAIFSGGLNAIKSVASAAWNALTSGASAAWNAFSSAVQSGITSAVGFVRGLPGSILGALGNLGSLLTSAGRAIIDGFVRGLRAAWDAGMDFIRGIAGWITGNKGPIEKDRVLLRPAGLAIMSGFVRALKSGMPWLKNTIADVNSTVTDITIPDLSATSRSIRNRTSGTSIVINVNGALDPAAVARQIRNLLNHDARIRGVTDINGLVAA